MSTEKRILSLILLLFVLLGATYAIVTPVFEASDELWHYPMVRHLADGNPLPVQTFDPEAAGPWKQEASQPPLYYYVGAALTWWIDTSDMEQVRRLNPHVDNGVITADGNINLVVHDPAANSWQGTLLAVRIVRLASVLMGAATVYFTYRLAGAVVPGRPEIALGAAAVNAFTPMFLFISGSVNNDNLAIMLASLALVQMVVIVQRQYSGRRGEIGRVLLLGVVIGLAVLTKEGTLALIPLAGGALVVRRWRVARGRGQVVQIVGASLGYFGLVLLPVLLIAGWWYYRNVVLYGDWLGWNAFIAVLGQRPQPAGLAQLWGERHGFLMAYWGLFGGVNVPMWRPVYWVLNGVLLLSVGGFVVYLGQQRERVRSVIAAVREEERGNGRPAGFLTRSLDVLLRVVYAYFPLVICLLFAAAVIYGLINWTTITWSSQGRLVFTAIAPLSTLLVVGLVGWLKPRPARVMVGALGGFLLLLAALVPFLVIRPAYDPAAYFPPRYFGSRPAQLTFDDSLRLTGYTVEPERLGTSVARPGEYVDVTLSWEVLRPLARDWSVFVHLNDPVVNTPVAQRDMYHGQGLRPTSMLRPGEELLTYYRLYLPAAVPAPSQLELVVGLYDFASNERLEVANGEDAARLAVLVVEPHPGEYPNSLEANFGDEIELVGYEVTPRRVRPGAPLTLILYWRPLRALSTDYSFTAQVLDVDTTRWASADVAPEGGTSSYPAGEVQALTLPLEVDGNAPAGVFPLRIGIYTRTAGGGFRNLQVVEDGRITMLDLLTLTQIRIE